MTDLSIGQPSGAAEIRLVRMPELLGLTGLSRSTAHRLMKNDPTFPKPVKLSDSTARNAPVAFVLSEVQAWIQGRIEARGQSL
ncbi:helix-turn-helix transcriptional regulator [Metapseudomonas furukawaii]|uniref:Predicted transcriptional regulator n=1 Tax=Metapseudomonas furukawaii TaxID=1149133 RepID=A0AAD1C1P9_METFU|nr:AlpA family phage regulatory protein [Pseudomonas furukawaii]ELS28579.1 Prophage CP4-57 regulatory [Pseudomonas furukawaii]BAU75165.1 predicted transcriptional regulator [Pseudomonas furukawaii]